MKRLMWLAALIIAGCADDARLDGAEVAADLGADLGSADLSPELGAPDESPDLAPAPAPTLTVLWPQPGARLPGGRLVLRLEVEGADEVRWQLDTHGWRAWPGAGHVAPLPPGSRLLRIEARAGQAVTTREIPFEVGAHLSAGTAHSGALIAGQAWLWGDNASGQLGADPALPAPAGPHQLPDLAALAHMTGRGAGQGALDASGAAWLWGALPGGPAASHAPVKLGGSWLHMAHGGDALWLVNAAGELHALGRNDRGQLGIGAAGSTSSLTRAPQITDAVMVAAGTSHALVLRADGLVWAMGDNSVGQLGIGDVGQAAQLEPILIPTLSDVIQVAAGREHSLALTSAGEVYAWGSGTIGQLGHGTSGMLASRPQPVAVVGLPKIVAIAAVNLQSYAVGEDGSVWAWGQNSLGQLGVGNTTNSPRPRAVAIGAPVREVAAGLVHGVAVTRDGALWGWGSNDSAQLTADGPARSSTPLVLPTR